MSGSLTHHAVEAMVGPPSERGKLTLFGRFEFDNGVRTGIRDFRSLVRRLTNSAHEIDELVVFDVMIASEDDADVTIGYVSSSPIDQETCRRINQSLVIDIGRALTITKGN
jgi:hypothetical protein